MKQNPKRIGRSDITDLNEDPIVVWQHVHYLVRSNYVMRVLIIKFILFADTNLSEMRYLHGFDISHSGLRLGMG